MQFGVLGPLEVTADGVRVAVSSGQQRRLLAGLLVHRGTVVSTDRLIAALWGDDPPPTALQSLRAYVHRLRSTLAQHGGAELLETRASGYLLAADPACVDAHRFEVLLEAVHRRQNPSSQLADVERALDLWRGPAFSEFADAEFARSEARRLDELRRVAIEERADALLALGRHAEAVGELQAFTDHHPLRERPREQLMLALYRSGRESEALAVGRDLRDLLGEEGLDVPDSMAALERDILRQSPGLGAPGRRASDAGPRTRRPASVPAEVSSLVGRDEDVQEVMAELRQARLVTVTGVGGVGKTRVALRVAHRLAGDVPVWWCQLSPIEDPDSVPDALATTLGVRPGEGRDATTSIIDLLAVREAVLVIDNCEHVLVSLAPLLRQILRSCPNVTILATSRARIGVEGEHVQPLDPLELAADGDGDGSQAPAMQLLVERAVAVRPDLELDEAQRTVLAEVCRRLDGLPLAIELAASRLRSLHPTDLAERLDRRFELIIDRRREADRHGGLRAVIDWSHGLLSSTEQVLFRRLSVFAGSFSLVAAEQVCAGAGVAADEILDLLTRLVDHSMIAAVPMAGTTRYSLLETLRAYAREQLEVEGEPGRVRRRHAEHYRKLAEAADADVRGREEAHGVATLDQDTALRLSAALFRYTMFRLRAEIFGWAETVVELPGAERHRLLPTVAGMAAWGAGLRGELELASELAELGLAASDTDGDPRRLVPLEILAHLAMWQGDLDTCLGYARRGAELTDDPYEMIPREVESLACTYAGRPEEGLVLAEGLQADADRYGNPTMRSMARYARGEALLDTEPQRAVPILEEAMELAAAVDNHMLLGITGVSLVSLHARHGDPNQALSSFATVIERLHEAGDWTHLWTGLRSLVTVLASLERDEPCAVLLGAVLGAATAPPVYGDDAKRLTTVETLLQQRLGAEALAAVQARGRTMSDQDAVEYARQQIDQARKDLAANNIAPDRPTAV